MSTITAEHSAAEAADRLVAALPLTRPLTARRVGVLPQEALEIEGVSAQLVGSPSASLLLMLVDTTALELAGGDTVSTADLLLPALEAAAGAIGRGAVSLAGADRSVLDGPMASRFELLDGQTAVGWFAVRVESEAASLDFDVLSKIGRINDVEMALSVVLGRTRRQVREVLSLEPGSVVELDRAAGEPAELLVNGHLVAMGEVVVVNQHYAVRVTRILDAPGETD